MNTGALITVFGASTKRYAGYLCQINQAERPDPESLAMLSEMLQLLMEIHDEVFTFRVKKIVLENNPYMPPLISRV